MSTLPLISRTEMSQIHLLDSSTVVKQTCYRWGLSDISWLRMLKHPNIIPLQDYSIKPDKEKIRLTMRQGISVLHHTFNRQEFIRLAKDLLEALNFLHDHGVCHCDIKTQNVLFLPKKREQKHIDLNGRYVLIDFGFARSTFAGYFHGIAYSHGFRDLSFFGDYNSSDCDLYALGKTLLSLYTKQSHQFDDRLDGVDDDEVKELLSSMLIDSPLRKSYEELLSLPLFSSLKRDLRDIFCRPKIRIPKIEKIQSPNDSLLFETKIWITNIATRQSLGLDTLLLTLHNMHRSITVLYIKRGIRLESSFRLWALVNLYLAVHLNREAQIDLSEFLKIVPSSELKLEGFGDEEIESRYLLVQTVYALEGIIAVPTTWDLIRKSSEVYSTFFSALSVNYSPSKKIYSSSAWRGNREFGVLRMSQIFDDLSSKSSLPDEILYKGLYMTGVYPPIAPPTFLLDYKIKIIERAKRDGLLEISPEEIVGLIYTMRNEMVTNAEFSKECFFKALELRKEFLGLYDRVFGEEKLQALHPYRDELERLNLNFYISSLKKILSEIGKK